MKRLLPLLAMGILTSCQLGIPTLPPTPNGSFVPGTVLVQFKSGTSQKTIQSINQAVGVTQSSTVTSHGLWNISVPSGQERAYMRRYMDHPQVAYVDYARLLSTEMVGGFRPYLGRAVQTTAPNDPLYGPDPLNPTTGAREVGLPGQWGLNAMDVLDAWNKTQGSNVKVAVLDTGVDMGHPDLAANLDTADAYNFVDNNTNPDDDYGHGTHVTGIIAAVANNQVGVAGVAPACKVMPIRVLGVEGGSTVNLIQGIEWAIDHGAKAINISLGSDQYDQAEADEINRAIASDVVVVAAAGNDALTGDPLSYPGALPGVVSVAALQQDLDANGNPTGTYSRASFSDFNPFVTVAAPGVDILSTVPRRFQSYGTTHSDEPYAYASGTSMAAPMVTGVVALIRSAHPDWTASQVISDLRSTAQQLGTGPFNQFYGSGLVQAAKAVR